MAFWEPWTGCYAHSEGCRYCYYYGPYSKRYGQNTIERSADFYKPIEMKTKIKYKIEGGSNVAMCFATDFFLPEADVWRAEAWQMIRQRQDLRFMFLTKRIERFHAALPEGWGEGYENVSIGCTVENQQMAQERLPLFLSYPIKHRFISATPLLSAIDLSPYLQGIEHVSTGGETSREARVCDFEWVLDIREQCRAAGVSFWFKNTGSRFVKDEVLHKVNPRLQHAMARDFQLNLDAQGEETTRSNFF